MDTVTILIIVAAIWLLIYIIAQAVGIDKLNEKGVDAGFPFFLLLKTERLNSFLTKMGKKTPRLFWNAGVFVGFFGMIFGFYIFADNFLKFFTTPDDAGGVVPIIPGVTIKGLPLIYMMIGLSVTLLTHEFGHGLASARDDIPIKSSGLLFFYVIFGGFVEPDDEVFEKEASPKARMRLLGAGSFMNILTGLVVLLLIANFASLMSIGFNPPSGAYIYDVVADSPGAEALQVGDIIIGINETTIETWDEVGDYMENALAGDQITIYTLDADNPTIILAPHDSNASLGYIGVYGADYWEPKPGWDAFLSPMFAFHLQQTLVWLWIVLISVGLFNLLPVPALDGDKLLSNGLSLIIKDENKIRYLMWPARIISLTIVLLSIIFSLWMGKGILG
ncbi:MAG: site-2 protease family protein [Candidatus Hodarchaeota archaeon]